MQPSTVQHSSAALQHSSTAAQQSSVARHMQHSAAYAAQHSSTAHQITAQQRSRAAQHSTIQKRTAVQQGTAGQPSAAQHSTTIFITEYLCCHLSVTITLFFRWLKRNRNQKKENQRSGNTNRRCWLKGAWIIQPWWVKIFVQTIGLNFVRG